MGYEGESFATPRLILTCAVLPDDMDMYMHQNNSRYHQYADYGRFQVRSGVLDSYASLCSDVLAALHPNGSHNTAQVRDDMAMLMA